MYHLGCTATINNSFLSQQMSSQQVSAVGLETQQILPFGNLAIRLFTHSWIDDDGMESFGWFPGVLD